VSVLACEDGLTVVADTVQECADGCSDSKTEKCIGQEEERLEGTR